ncbi:uridine diphosphate-N-acetylglucosamine-binding protein YvcK [Shewanella sp. ULN5]|uniref:uridine diphosphate-N-acetylglucosamine-binding protein YvcK n=1 Tax=Shewanella sp. ULN5 TaxID=2994678 RepID=UPI00273E8518|nr:uridine diphosphate-N-acetylglucosamine-binding protein YvcK [Shewanella sp. ULN5]MDP5146517.1 uridine diphosphate-N-acetylglucosamine-binding protein YvcK [Shewanella sp. ULN5]
MLNQRLASFNKVVAIGGGHGLGRVLASLSFLGDRLTGIVATTDNGGSTGRLRQDQHTIAWGDLRNCLSHLTPRPSLSSQLFDHRFIGNNELSGHNLGNVILHALDQLCVRPLDAVKLVSSLLKINTSIIPMSEASTHLTALTYCGNKIIGELSVDEMKEAPVALSLEPKVDATIEACDAIVNADLIILGPGSFLTSIIPPLLLPKIAKSIQNSHAKVILIDNLTDEFSVANQFSICEKINWIHQVVGSEIISDVIQQYQLPSTQNSEHSAIKFHQFDLVSSHHKGLHDKTALGDAICQITRI